MNASKKRGFVEENIETKFETNRYYVNVSFRKEENNSSIDSRIQPINTSTIYKITEKQHPENTIKLYIAPNDRSHASDFKYVLYVNVDVQAAHLSRDSIFNKPLDGKTARERQFVDVFKSMAEKQERPDNALLNFIDMYVSNGIRNLPKIELQYISDTAKLLNALQDVKDDLQDTKISGRGINLNFTDLLRGNEDRPQIEGVAI
jgi:hypothetical protein